MKYQSNQSQNRIFLLFGHSAQVYLQINPKNWKLIEDLTTIVIIENPNSGEISNSKVSIKSVGGKLEF